MNHETYIIIMSIFAGIIIAGYVKVFGPILWNKLKEDIGFRYFLVGALVAIPAFIFYIIALVVSNITYMFIGYGLTAIEGFMVYFARRYNKNIKKGLTKKD